MPEQPDTYRAHDLREDIRAAELSVAAVRRDTPPREIFDLFERLDRVAEGYEGLDQSGIDLRAELTRIETVTNILVEKSPTIVRSAKLGGLEQRKGEKLPPAEHWWWYLDERVQQDRSRQLRRAIWWAGGIVVATTLLLIAYMIWLRPDEATRLYYSHITDAELHLQDGDYEAALQSYQAAVQAVPDDPETELMLGVVYAALDQPQAAETAFAKALDLYGDQTQFLAMRSIKYSALGWHEKAEADATAALDIDDQFALGHFALANTYEGQERYPEAVQALQQCATLASSQGQDELYVIATSRLATLLQGSPL